MVQEMDGASITKCLGANLDEDVRFGESSLSANGVAGLIRQDKKDYKSDFFNTNIFFNNQINYNNVYNNNYNNFNDAYSNSDVGAESVMEASKVTADEGRKLLENKQDYKDFDVI